MEIVLRREAESDYRAVELLHREAFWNLSEPGCTEHYLAHTMRSHPDFLPDMDYVAACGGEIVGSILCARSRLISDDGAERPALTFGPISVAPGCQRRGVGKAMIERVFQIALEKGFGACVIFGNPDNYVSRGFKSCVKYNVCMPNGAYPAALLVKELTDGFFDGSRQRFFESSAYNLDLDAARAFDQAFPPKQRGYQPSQEEFFIHSRSTMRHE